MKKLYLLLWISSLTFMVNAQQESSFSHYMFNHQAVNPAYVGSRGVTNFTSVFTFTMDGY